MSKQPEGWQDCPLCNGSGEFGSANERARCPQCGGERVVHAEKGLPPKELPELHPGFTRGSDGQWRRRQR